VFFKNITTVPMSLNVEAPTCASDDASIVENRPSRQLGMEKDEALPVSTEVVEQNDDDEETQQYQDDMSSLTLSRGQLETLLQVQSRLQQIRLHPAVSQFSNDVDADDGIHVVAEEAIRMDSEGGIRVRVDDEDGEPEEARVEVRACGNRTTVLA
jgi:hypothetical protein